MKILVCALYIVMLSATQGVNAKAPELNVQQLDQIDVANLQVQNPTQLSAGQPTREQLQKLAKLGVKHVINLRPEAEQRWSEQQYVESLGMQYYSIAVAGKQGVTMQKARELAKLMTRLENESVLVHCASSNRVGALIALSAYDNGLSVEAAISKGKQWGLKSLTPVVENLITK